MADSHSLGLEASHAASLSGEGEVTNVAFSSNIVVFTDTGEHFLSELDVF